MPSRRCRSRQRNRIFRCIPVRRPTAIDKGIISRTVLDDNFIFCSVTCIGLCIATIYRRYCRYTIQGQLIFRRRTSERRSSSIYNARCRKRFRRCIVFYIPILELIHIKVNL